MSTYGDFSGPCLETLHAVLLYRRTLTLNFKKQKNS